MWPDISDKAKANGGMPEIIDACVQPSGHDVTGQVASSFIKLCGYAGLLLKP